MGQPRSEAASSWCRRCNVDAAADHAASAWPAAKYATAYRPAADVDATASWPTPNVDATASWPTTVNATALDATALDATTFDATTIDATAFDATADHAAA